MINAMLKCTENFKLIGQVSAEILTNSHIFSFALRRMGTLGVDDVSGLRSRLSMHEAEAKTDKTKHY